MTIPSITRLVILLASLTLPVTGCLHLAGKTVAAKEPPNLLIATDGSVCTVSAKRFEKVQVGLKELCAWHATRLPTPRAAARTSNP